MIGVGAAVLDSIVDGEVVQVYQVLVHSHVLLLLDGLLVLLPLSIALLLLLNEFLDF